ncbi:MAG: protein kinase [Planctomycetes bacterium]|nr:protein kinase [Planctomycetota bacterium]
MAVNTRDDFIDVLEKSALLNAARLDEARRLVQGLTEPAAMARKLVQQNLISRWQAQQLLSGRHSLFISKYRLLDLLGQDAVGPIYLAEHTQMDRRVILKTLARREGNSSAAVEKFLSETAALATLDHRHLCHIYDVDREGDFYYLVMEHVQGRNLQQVVDSDGPMSCEAAAGLVGLAADAMGHAHQHGILHLGLRPDRLVVDGQGMLKVLDIGVARLADKESPDGSSIQQADKYAYQAPEQISGTSQPDARVDVFALGSVLCLLLTGEAPQLNGEQKSLDIRQRRRDVPLELAQICQKMTARRPKDRYSNATEAAAALETWLQQAETAKAAVRSKAAAAKPRPSGASETEENGDVVVDTRPVSHKSEAATTASGAQVVTSKKSGDRLKLVLGGGIGVGLVAILAVAALLFRGSGTTPPTGTIVAATTGGNPAVVAPPPVALTNTQQIPEDGEPIVRHMTPVKMTGTEGTTFLSQLEGVVLVDGNLPGAAEYQIIAKSEEPSIAGLRLDVLSHMLLGNGRKGVEKPAKFRLSEIKIETASDEKFTKPEVLKIVQATGDYNESGMPASKAIDGNRKTHWGADSKANQDHWATFWFDHPQTAKKDAPRWFRVTLDQAEKGMRIYEFRLSAVSGKRPESATDMKPEPPAANGEKLPILAYWRFEKSTAVAGGAETAAKPAVVDTSESKNHLYLPGGGEPARFSTSVAGAKVRSTGEPNGQSLDDTQPAKSKEKGAAWGLVTIASRTPRDLASFKFETWTIEASFLLDRLGFTHAILGKDGLPKAGSHAPLQVRVRGDNDRIEIEAVDSTGAPRRVESTASVVPGRWYHLAAASDGQQLRLWVDAGDGGGLELQGGAPFTGPLAQSPGEWSVGRGFSEGLPADDALMLIDEVRISASPLEPPQMLMYATPAELAAEKAALATQQVAPAPSGGKIKFHPLKILDVQLPEGVKYQPQDDGSLLLQGASPEKAEYVIRAHTEAIGIVGFRLEAMADYRLPGHGPGRHPNTNKTLAGNFIVTSLTVAGTARESERRPAVFAWKSAEADVSQEKFSIASLIDKDPAGGWGIAPVVGKGHYAILKTERPVGYAGGTWLTFTIGQNAGQKQTLGRLRLSAMTGDKPGEDPAEGVLATDKFADPLGKLARRVSLPPLPEEGAPSTEEMRVAIGLGQIYNEPKSPVELKLLGGETAVETEGVVFRLEPNETMDEKSRRWKFLLQTAEGAAPAVVAEAAMVGKELKFRWTDEGIKLPLANHLRNCVLEVSVGKLRRGVSLREPVAMERLDLGFGRTGSRPRHDIPFLPKLAGVKFKLPAEQADFPPYKISEEVVDVGKGKTEITFHEEGQPDLIAVVDASLKKGFQFGVDAFMLRQDNKRQPFSRSALEKLKRKWTADFNRQQVFVNRFGPTPKDAAAAAKKKAVEVMQAMETEMKGLIRVMDRAEEIEKKGGLPATVYVEVDKYRVVLLESQTEQ